MSDDDKDTHPKDDFFDNDDSVLDFDRIGESSAGEWGGRGGGEAGVPASAEGRAMPDSGSRQKQRVSGSKARRVGGGRQEGWGADGSESDDKMAWLGSDDAAGGAHEDRAWLADQYRRMQHRSARPASASRTPQGMAGHEFDDSSDGDMSGERGQTRKAGPAHSPHCPYSEPHLHFLLNSSQANECDDLDTPWWISIADKWPHVEQARQERERLLRQGDASFCLFEALGRRLSQHTIPLSVPPHLIPRDWFVDEFLGCALGGYTDRLRLLLARAPIRVDTRGGEGNWSALLLTAVDGRYNTARALVAAGVSVLASLPGARPHALLGTVAVPNLPCRLVCVLVALLSSSCSMAICGIILAPMPWRIRRP